ncbi:MAG: hypothetical protein ACREM8_15030 [Vulcanimicrobiaceae bacterium]
MKRAARALPPGEQRQRATGQVRVEETTRPSLLNDKRGNRVALPSSIPEWRRDKVTLSKRALALLAKLKPFVIRVLTFWDHRVTSTDLDELRLEIDASGSYHTL